MEKHQFKNLYEAIDERGEFSVPASMIILARNQVSDSTPTGAYFISTDILAPNSITHVYLSIATKNKATQIKNVGAFSFINLKKEESWPSVESLNSKATISAAFLKMSQCCKAPSYVILESPGDNPRKNFEKEDADVVLLHRVKNKPNVESVSKYFGNMSTFATSPFTIANLEGLRPQILVADLYEQSYSKKEFNRLSLGWVNKEGQVAVWTAESVGSVLKLINNPISKNSCPQKKSGWTPNTAYKEALKIYKAILPALLAKEVLEL